MEPGTVHLVHLLRGIYPHERRERRGIDHGTSKHSLVSVLPYMERPWNAEFRVVTRASPEDGELLEGALAEDPYLPLKLEHELEHSDGERAAIVASNEALARLTERLGVPETRVPERRIHILTEAEFNTKVARQAHAKTIFGHVYVPRAEDPVQFARLLTHELCHAASSYRIHVIQSEEARHVRAWERKTGLTFQPKPGATAETYFNGLNEAATELSARILRPSVTEAMPDLTSEQRHALEQVVQYRPWVVLASALMRVIEAGEKLPRGEAQHTLLQDYFRGTHDFLKRLERQKKGSTQILRTLGGSPAEALKGADLLSLREARAAILKLDS